MRIATVIVLATMLASCKGEVVTDQAVRRGRAPYTERVAVVPAVPAETWSSLAGTRVWFGHQSIGRNVLEGVRDLGDTTTGRAATITTLADSATAPATGSPLVVEFPIGENGYPLTKLEGFAAALDGVAPDARGVALFEYCFLDVTAATDVDALWARHETDLAALRARHPQLTFVQMTVPLTVDEPLARRLVKGLLGRKTSRDANAKREAFNALLRREYAGEPIFDIARVQSTRADGSRVTGGDGIPMLAPELSDDGAHLNAAGRRAAAAAFLETIAAAAGRSPAVAQATTR